MNASLTTLDVTTRTDPADSSKSGDAAGLRRDIALVAVVICLAAALVYIAVLRSRLVKCSRNKTTDKATTSHINSHTSHTGHLSHTGHPTSHTTNHKDVLDLASQPTAAVDLESGAGRVYYNPSIRGSRPWRDANATPWRSVPLGKAQPSLGDNDYWPSFPTLDNEATERASTSQGKATTVSITG